MQIIICGDRNWTDIRLINEFLDHLYPWDDTILHGMAKGADTIADNLGHEKHFTVKRFPAQWWKIGHAAGPIRNKKMIDQRPDLVVAFHSCLEKSKGTKSMVNLAVANDIPVIKFSGFVPKKRWQDIDRFINTIRKQSGR